MKELSKQYNPVDVESRIYKEWEEGDYFRPEKILEKNPSAEPYTIILPPPNANDPLHVGHAMYTVEDAFIRYHRMLGRASLWLPGADHAGFETQVVFERKLAEEGKSRFDFEPEQLRQQIWDYVQENKSTMERQLRHLGFSLDWSREKFTLDPDVVSTAHHTFKRLYDDGLIYRGKRVVNYCTHHGTSFSELEVKYVEREDTLYCIEYPLEEGNGKITVATTRPETMLGDTAIAVNPKDERFSSLIGKIAVLPLVGRRLPIVADEAVDPEFGTGAVKVTPAHSVADDEIAQRHNLPYAEVIRTDGKVYADDVEGFTSGQAVEQARRQVIELLSDQIVKREPLHHSVGTCYKCGNVLEALLIDQWLIRTKELAAPAMAAVQNGDIEIVPKRFEKVYFNWMENIRDWNISRQIVWGIPIPAFIADDGEVVVDIEEQGSELTREGKLFKRDPDVFDTWFSSGQWPLITLGYPNREDFRRFYPTSLMETGYDILFFWVARMIMLGLYMTRDQGGVVPFKVVYLHGLVRNEGQKMSKSKGNSVNPIEIAEKFGSDALRFALLVNSVPGSDPSISTSEIEGYRNFVNKLWNIARFILLKNGDNSATVVADIPFDGNNIHSGILHELEATAEIVTSHLEDYRLDLAAKALYDFTWKTFADKYIEMAKHDYDERVALTVLEGTLKLLHPFMPFVTEEIWSHLPGREDLLIISRWPRYDFKAVGDEFARIVAEDSNRDKEKRIAELEPFIAGLKSRLSDRNFADKAPKEVVVKQQEKLERAEEELQTLKKS